MSATSSRAHYPAGEPMNGPIEPAADLRQIAATLHQTFLALVQEGVAMSVDPEIVRKVAEALSDALDAAYDTSIYRWPQQEDIPPIAAAVLTVAEPLIRAQVADELHERARAFAHASPESIAVRRELMISANNIARGGQ